MSSVVVPLSHPLSSPLPHEPGREPHPEYGPWPDSVSPPLGFLNGPVGLGYPPAGLVCVHETTPVPDGLEPPEMVPLVFPVADGMATVPEAAIVPLVRYQFSGASPRHSPTGTDLSPFPSRYLMIAGTKS